MRNRKFQIVYIILALCIVGIFLFLQFHKSLFPLFFHRAHTSPKMAHPERIFGISQKQPDLPFPVNKPEFVVQITSLKNPQVKQQSITIIDSKNKQILFQRGYYADMFRGDMLTYTLASDSASFIQSGSLGSIGCKDSCGLSWSNFYIWDRDKQEFVSDNASHKDYFRQLSSTYGSLDQKGCQTINSGVISDQTSYSFTELYKKYPNLNSYCSNTEGILHTNLVFFLQTEKIIQHILKGENISSAEISQYGI